MSVNSITPYNELVALEQGIVGLYVELSSVCQTVHKLLCEMFCISNMYMYVMRYPINHDKAKKLATY